MTSTTTSTLTDTNTLTLTGSASLVRDFLYYSLNSILYQRQLLSNSSFTWTSKYGMKLVVSRDESFVAYAKDLFPQLEQWLKEEKLFKVVVPVVKSGEVVERWQFNIRPTSSGEPGGDNAQTNKKPIQEVRRELCSLLQQVSCANTFLPCLSEGEASFKLVTYCRRDTADVAGWHEGGPMAVGGAGGEAQLLHLGQLDTGVHAVGGHVEYKVREWEWG